MPYKEPHCTRLEKGSRITRRRSLNAHDWKKKVEQPIKVISMCMIRDGKKNFFCTCIAALVVRAFKR